MGLVINEGVLVKGLLTSALIHLDMDSFSRTHGSLNQPSRKLWPRAPVPIRSGG